MAQDKLKVLFVGDVEGRFDEIFTQVNAVNAKAGPFAAMLCVGRFFAPDGCSDALMPYLTSEKRISVPTYFITGDEDPGKGSTSLVDDIQDGGEVCKNLTFLGRAGAKRLPCGLSVAYLSGAYKPDKYALDAAFAGRRNAKTLAPHYISSDVDEIVRAARGGEDGEENEEFSLAGVDVLLTAEWGEKFDALLPDTMSHPLASATEDNLSPAVTRLATKVAARYHVAGTEGAYFAPPPYRNALHATRFYGLGKVGNAAGAKSLVAVAVTPTAQLALDAARTGARDGGDACTPCPYTYERPKPRVAEPEEDASTPAAAVGPAPRDHNAPKRHEDLPSGEWKCGMCGNVNSAHQQKHCHMKKCGAPREGDLELWRMQNMSFNGRGAKRDADGAIVNALGGVRGAGGGEGRVYSMMSKAEAEAAAAAAAAERAAAAEEEAAKRAKMTAKERTSLYASQKTMTAKQKYRKGTSNPGAWR